jgi:hypothetical protein
MWTSKLNKNILIAKFISDSTAAKQKINYLLVVWILFDFTEHFWYYDNNSAIAISHSEKLNFTGTAK